MHGVVSRDNPPDNDVLGLLGRIPPRVDMNSDPKNTFKISAFCFRFEPDLNYTLPWLYWLRVPKVDGKRFEGVIV